MSEGEREEERVLGGQWTKKSYRTLWDSGRTGAFTEREEVGVVLS